MLKSTPSNSETPHSTNGPDHAGDAPRPNAPPPKTQPGNSEGAHADGLKAPKPAGGNDLGTADTAMQPSKTQPMDGAPKPPQQGKDLGMADTARQQSKTQPMEGAPKLPEQTPAQPYTDELRAAAKREFDAFKELQKDPKSTEKQQAFQEAQRAADEHRIEATRAERNARVEAEKRYGEAEAEFDAAKAARDKTPETDAAGRAAAENRYQEAYNKLDKANDDYNQAHVKEVDAWGKAGGMRGPPKDVPTREADAASPASQLPQPSPSSTPPMETPVARPDKGVAAGEPPMASPKAGTLDRVQEKPVSPVPKSDLGTADTSLQPSKTQPMNGAPKPPQPGRDLGTADTVMQQSKTQPMDAAPEGTAAKRRQEILRRAQCRDEPRNRGDEGRTARSEFTGKAAGLSGCKARRRTLQDRGDARRA